MGRLSLELDSLDVGDDSVEAEQGLLVSIFSGVLSQFPGGNLSCTGQ